MIVILRQPEDSEEFSQIVRDHGFEPLIEPILSIEYLDEDIEDLTSETPLVFTSAHGVRAFARQREERDNPVYTVGRNTAETAREAGFGRIETAAGTVEDLAELLSKPTQKGLICPLYIRGDEISRDLKQILSLRGLKLREFIAYKAISASDLSLKLLQSLDKREINAIAFFSGRGARTFAALIEQYGRTVRLKTVQALCISEPVVQSLSVLPFQSVAVAQKPDRYGMMKLVENISVSEERL